AYPRRDVMLEELALRLRRSRKAPAREARHDLAQDSSVILRLGVSGRALDTETAQSSAQARERSLVEKAADIVRSVGQKLAASDPDEEVEIPPLRALHAGPAGSLRERNVGKTERCRITLQAGQPRKQLRIRGAREERCKERIFLRARGIDFIHDAARYDAAFARKRLGAARNADRFLQTGVPHWAVLFLIRLIQPRLWPVSPSGQ